MQRLGRNAISTTAAAIIIVVLIIAVAAGIYFFASSGTTSSTSASLTTSTTSTTSLTTTHSTTSTTSTTSLTTSSSSTSSTGPVPTTFSYESAETPEYLDPGISYFSYDYNIMQNVYEPLLWYNASCSTCVIPWLAQSYTVSSDQKVYSFTLRSGITFADGEPLNSTAVYFSLNRLLVFDGSTPTGHATQATWLIAQLLNASLSTTLSGAAQSYGNNYVKQVLAENFVQITGPLTFNINVMNPSSAVPELLAGQWATIIAPNYVMQHDLAMWNTSSAGYKIPNAALTGTTQNKIDQYLQDLSSTCNAGSTLGGCGATYLNTSQQGSLAGTGPYVLTSNQLTSNTITLTARQGYWGGPYSKAISPQIKTVIFKFVPDVTTREIDLQNAAKSGQALAIDLPGTNLYDIADRSAWLNTNTLTSDISGVSLYGTFPFYGLTFDPFDTNVTNALSGQYYKFQPFADLRMRTAFADAVNMTDINIAVNNKVGTVALNVVPPGLPPTGSFNSSITPAYSFNPDQVQAMLLSAMQSPLTSFKFTNGSAAPAGFFDNAFGCATLGSNNKCSNPIPQTVPLVVPSGDTVDTAIFTQIASVINNVSAAYNMGLTVTVVPVPTGQLLANAFSVPTHYYMYALGWIDDYPWVLDFLTPMFAPNGAYTGADGWNLAQMATLNSQANAASQSGNIGGIVAASNAMNTLGNKEVMYLWTLYNVNFVTMTSNVQGFYFNPSLSTAAAAGVGPEYFATLY
ncbi:MAG: ABC transporter substrate-binding protein [Thaumarchaeota archaeon]|nr:ABC transporter substrate-binding protein [Nitrososphaerota archaeon]